MDSPPSSSFYADELRSVLQEQSFGIESFSIITTTPSQATASVKLLEGKNISIKLSSRGFLIEPDNPALDQEATFETIEALLQSVSREYMRKRHEALVNALEKLVSADSRNDDS
ncbi:putative protein of unknown function (DUF727) [Lyophyllum shimeji]|uniref:GSKIP domain-containing protein n=1 Tax=Lyophyllum shimeji TaxID=47721 RepID=A0A9P3UNY8_LYOSH|nr:putative protein of unknown function (DUF727) [Lyophyllum shimeji]